MSKTEKPLPQEVASRYKELRTELQNTYKQISTFEDDARDHARVITTLEELGPNRRCFRLVGDVLVERTQPEVLEAVKLNRQQILEMTGKLNTHLKDIEKEIMEIEKEYGNIKE